jgi:two-component system invasion response regulator UvrY
MIKVLVAEDHELVRLGIKRILESAADIEVIAEAQSGEDALDKARLHRPDVVLMDVHMPGMGGIEATRRITRALPETNVIALTVLDEDPFPAQLREAGAKGYLTKGCPAEEMFEAIRAVYSGSCYVAATVAKKHMLADLEGRADSPLARLSARELQILMMILDGQRGQDISDTLSLSPKTISTYRQRIYEKLGVDSDVELTKFAFRQGLLNDEL